MSPHKIALNIKESLEAKELLRQRHLSNGTVENLVRWRLHGSEKRPSSVSEESTSGSLSEESKVGKDVFLWMTNHELMVCSPHLYNTDATSSDQPLTSKNDENKLDEDGIDASSDVEDLDDMRHDVIKLVNRAKKQMHRMKKEGTIKPLTSLSHTTKVLSTYAGLGSLANVFRETGALDLILELLWTNDLDTRRAAGRMLRALALHDAGSRAYVLLSLTQDKQDEGGSDQKQHYADFENRAMVMEMFAETASGEEAHAVALDSVQLPQVPGKSLFTLMKCYLRVTSLMDGNNKGENKRNQQKLSWMRFESPRKDLDSFEDFEVAMAISDLIFELNNVMDWNSKSPKNGNIVNSDKHGDKESDKSVSPPPTPTLFGPKLKEIVKAIRKTKKDGGTTSSISPRDRLSDSTSPMRDITRKPLFLQSARESTIDPTLLSTLLKAGEPNTTIYKHPSAFASRRQYVDYVRSEIKPGFRVRACQSYQDVNEGDEGIFRQHNCSTPPVQVFWHRLNRTYWVYWNHILLLGEGSPDDSTEPKPPVKFAVCPEDSDLWPFLNGMTDRVKSLYGVQYANEDGGKDSSDRNEISRRNWWVLLFYVSRVSAERRESIKEYLLEKYPTTSHMCNIKPSQEDALFIMMEILKDVSLIDKENMRASPICRLLIDQIERTEREEKEKKKEAEKKKEEEEIKTNDEPKPDETSSNQQSTSSVACSSEEKAKEEDPEEEISVEEKAKAIEMGMRIGLIADEETQKKYIDVFLDKSAYDLSAKLWKMQQESKNVLKVSKYIVKSGRSGKITALACLKALVSRETSDSSIFTEKKEEMLSNLLVAAEDSDGLVVNLYLQVILECLKKQPEKEDEKEEFLINLAISGHLKTLFDMIAKFHDQSSIVHDAILCTCLILQAIPFAKNPSSLGDSTYMNMIVAIITSMFSATDPTQVNLTFDLGSDREAPPSSPLRAYLMAIDQLIKDANEPTDVSADSAKRSQVLYSALCVLCMVARKDQSKSLLNENDYVLQVVENGLKSSSLSGRVRRMLYRLKGLMITISHSDPLELEPSEDDFPSLDKSTDEEDSMADDVLISLFKEQPVPDSSPSDQLTDHITKLKALPSDQVRSTTATVINDLILPTLKKTSTLTNECAKCITSLKLFLVEFESVAKEGNLILFEAFWSVLVFFLQNILELCVSASNKSLSVEVTSDIIFILKSLSELDKDFAVFLCGLEAKQTISRLQEKHGTIANASDLCELITSCDRQRTLHNRLLAVVLGGCISTALQCIEEARRMQKQINIPLFDQLLSNLCKGADLELKEDKCYERLEVSSNTRNVSKLTDGNPKSYWESNGSSGAHWINVFMKKGIVVRKLSITVAQEDSSYMPSRIVVFGGTTASDVSTQLSCVNIGSTDRDVVVLENARRYWPIVRISIRRCQQGGIDTRIHGLEVVGPKPSFWPLLRRQLYIRTSLIYSVQVHSWVADASCQALNPSQIMKHKMLDVPSRLVKAIKFEQQFADEYLPNAESALVLGRACRSAFSIPILEDLLARPAKGNGQKCVLEHMLEAYISCNEKKNMDVDCLIFSSKLRRLLRLVVDLDQGGGRKSRSQTSSSSRSSKNKHEEHGLTTWSRRVQPLHKRFALSDSKMSRTGSTVSISAAVGATKHATDEAANASSDDSDTHEPLSYLPQIAEHWSKTIERKLILHYQAVLEPCGHAVGVTQCLEVTSAIFDKHDFFRKCSEDLFGTRSLFTITLNAAVWKAISALDLETKRKLGYLCTVILHYYISYQSKGLGGTLLLRLRSVFDNLRQFLSLASGTNFCDVFEQLYAFMLLKRISSGGVCLDVEERVCKVIQSCFRNKVPINLLQDVKYSQGLNSRFLASYMERCDMVTSNMEAVGSNPVEMMWRNYERIQQAEFEVTVFRPGACGNFVNFETLDLLSVVSCDFQVGSLMKEFELFFEHDRENHTARMFSAGKRPLSYITDYGYGVLQDLKNEIEITAKISACLSLLHFNQETNVSSSKLDQETLQMLIEKKIIFESAPNVYSVSDVIADDVNCLQSDDNHLTSLQQLSASLENNFNRTAAIVDCAIVNIMKHEHQCTADSLVEKTIRKCTITEPDRLASQAFCTASFVRARCEHQIHLGYIMRKDSSQLLIYNPDDTMQDCDEKDCDGNAQKVPDMSGMPSKNGDSKIFAEEFMKNISSSHQSSDVVGEIRKESEFATSFYKSASIFSLSETLPEELLQLDSNDPKSPDQNRKALIFHEIGDSANGRLHSFGTNMAPTTISSENFLIEIRNMISKLAEVLLLDLDDIEALLLAFEWNSDKLVDSYVNDQAKTMALIGRMENQGDAERRLSESGDELCPICINPITGPTLDVPFCKHVCCMDCWKTYLSTKLDQDQACSTTCPIGSCKTKITTQLFYKAFENEPAKQRKYDLSLVRSYVESDRSYSWCHNPKGCDFIIRMSKDGREEGWCTDCGWQTCFTCTYVEAHYPASCSHMSQWMDDGGYYEGMNEDAQSKHLARLIAKRCPNCQANIEKNDGCLHMKCIKCSHDFCWRCLQPWRPTHRDYYNCSSKVSKLAQSNMKFVEFNKRCQHHNMAKSFAFSTRDRLLNLNGSQDPEKLRYATDVCTTLAHCRRILAYCNVFNFYTTDTDKLNNIGYHSAVLENQTLALQEHLRDVLLGHADIQFMVSNINGDVMAKGRTLMNRCDASIKSIVEFSKQGMRIAAPGSGSSISVTDAGTMLLQMDGSTDGQIALNARPAGMSDEEDEIMENNQSEMDATDDDDDNMDSDEDVNMYSTDDDDEDDIEVPYDSDGALMDFDSDNDTNVLPHSDSDDLSIYD